MKKLISRTLCLILMLILALPLLTACGNKEVIKLGKYSLTQKEYVYLAGMYKKQSLVAISPNEMLTDDDLSLEISSGVTLGQYLNYKYGAAFEQSILSLLYSQLLFDEYGLTLTEEEKANINATAESIAYYYGDDALSAYGFDKKTLKSVYEKQYKENKVRQYILGENNEKITSEQKENYYLDNYLRYKTIIINTVYTIHTDSEGNKSFVYLTEDEKERQELLIKELKELLINKNKDYSYILLKDDLNLSYDELWEKYSDDKFYPGGCYETSNPTKEELQNNSVLSAAYQSKVGEIKTVTAKRYFGSSGEITGESGTTTIKPGDYFEYGTVFVKRLALDPSPYVKEENRDFFPQSSFEAAVASTVYFNVLTEYEATSAHKIEFTKKATEITFDTVKANELDYYYFYGEDD